MVRALDLYTRDPGSNPIKDVRFFQTMHYLLVANFHIHKNFVKAYFFETCFLCINGCTSICRINGVL